MNFSLCCVAFGCTHHFTRRISLAAVPHSQGVFPCSDTQEGTCMRATCSLWLTARRHTRGARERAQEEGHKVDARGWQVGHARGTLLQGDPREGHLHERWLVPCVGTQEGGRSRGNLLHGANERGATCWEGAACLERARDRHTRGGGGCWDEICEGSDLLFVRGQRSVVCARTATSSLPFLLPDTVGC